MHVRAEPGAIAIHGAVVKRHTTRDRTQTKRDSIGGQLPGLYEGHATQSLGTDQCGWLCCFSNCLSQVPHVRRTSRLTIGRQCCARYFHYDMWTAGNCGRLVIFCFFSHHRGTGARLPSQAFSIARVDGPAWANVIPHSLRSRSVDGETVQHVEQRLGC